MFRAHSTLIISHAMPCHTIESHLYITYRHTKYIIRYYRFKMCYIIASSFHKYVYNAVFFLLLFALILAEAIYLSLPLVHSLISLTFSIWPEIFVFFSINLSIQSHFMHPFILIYYQWTEENAKEAYTRWHSTSVQKRTTAK